MLKFSHFVCLVFFFRPSSPECSHVCPVLINVHNFFVIELYPTNFHECHFFKKKKYRAGELSEDEQQRILAVIQNPRQFKIPDWFLNRQKDHKDGKFRQIVSNLVDQNLREDIERMKKIRLHRGLRHYWFLKVRGQHMKTTGRRGRSVGVTGKK